jgi:hypothetical protein
MFFGSYGYFFSNKSINSRDNYWILFFLFISIILLFLSDPVIGLIQSLQNRILGNSYSILTNLIYLFLGFGWLRINENKTVLICSVLMSGIILSTLPYFYERIGVFSMIAPMIVWVSLKKHELSCNHDWKIKVASFFSLLIAIFYNTFGIL